MKQVAVLTLRHHAAASAITRKHVKDPPQKYRYEEEPVLLGWMKAYGYTNWYLRLSIY